MVEAVKRNYPQREIAEARFELQQRIDSRRADRRRRQRLHRGRRRRASSCCGSTPRSSASRSTGCRPSARGATPQAVEEALAAHQRDGAREDAQPHAAAASRPRGRTRSEGEIVAPSRTSGASTARRPSSDRRPGDRGRRRDARPRPPREAQRPLVDRRERSRPGRTLPRRRRDERPGDRHHRPRDRVLRRHGHDAVRRRPGRPRRAARLDGRVPGRAARAPAPADRRRQRPGGRRRLRARAAVRPAHRRRVGALRLPRAGARDPGVLRGGAPRALARGRRRAVAHRADP